MHDLPPSTSVTLIAVGEPEPATYLGPLLKPNGDPTGLHHIRLDNPPHAEMVVERNDFDLRPTPTSSA